MKSNPNAGVIFLCAALLAGSTFTRVQADRCDAPERAAHAER